MFNHYVSAKLALLVGLEALVLILSLYIGVIFPLSGFETFLAGSQASARVAALPLAMMLFITGIGLYQPDPGEDRKSFQLRLLGAGLLGGVAAVFLSSLVPSLHLGSAGLAVTAAVTLAGSGLVRLCFFKFGDLRAWKPRVLVLGTGSRVIKFAEAARRSHVVVGYVAFQPARHHVPVQNVLRIAPGESLACLAEKHRVDQILIGVMDRRGGGLPVQQLLECRLKGIRITELHDFFERECRQVLLESLNPSWMVFGKGFRLGFFADLMKRLLDLSASTVLLLAATPVVLAAALCVFVDSGFPVLYRQERVGRGGRVFTLYKLRSMKNDAEQDGTPRWAAVDDERTTRVGRILRKLRIDELPQIINVFKGEMSFVGPRPERPFFVERLREQIPYYSMRHSIKPGITGWAQVNCRYGASFDDAVEKLQYDLYYVKNHGLFLDLMILIHTVEVVLRGKGAR